MAVTIRVGSREAWLAMAVGVARQRVAQVIVSAPNPVGIERARALAMRVFLPGFVAMTLIGCAGADSSPDIEDPENDGFLVGDAKADAFGVEDFSPDGAAVLELVSTASTAKLHDEVGLSTRVADSILGQRAMLGGKIEDLADLDDARFVGKTVFKRLLRFVTDNHLFKTSLRVPLVLEDADGKTLSITSFNEQAKAVGVTGFARYTFVDPDTQFSDKMSSYDMRLQELATKAGITIDGEMMRFASSLEDYKIGTQGVCYIGDPKEAADVSSSQGDSMMGDMYIVWGWRHQETTFLDDAIEDADAEFGTDWSGWDTASDDVLIMATNSDGGDNPSGAVVPPCRH